VQVNEVLQEIQKFYPEILFDVLLVETTGDLDQKTSLRTLEKTDFFTKEIDALLLKGECRLAIHSAKDLPDPLPKGLALAALTRGVDPSDALVVREVPLKRGARIGTSSLRREERVRALSLNLECVDIRGTIEQRLELLDSGEVDGVVIAEAALIRLGLTERLRLPLPGPTAPLQGQLAVIVQSEDHEMKGIFSIIDARLS
jgi:hydroxymethylbilane synthase